MNCKNCGIHAGVHPVDKLQRISETIGNIVFEFSTLEVSDKPEQIELLARLLDIDKDILKVAEELGK